MELDLRSPLGIGAHERQGGSRTEKHRPQNRQRCAEPSESCEARCSSFSLVILLPKPFCISIYVIAYNIDVLFFIWNSWRWIALKGNAGWEPKWQALGDTLWIHGRVESNALKETSDPWTTDLRRAGFGARWRQRTTLWTVEFRVRFDVTMSSQSRVVQSLRTVPRSPTANSTAFSVPKAHIWSHHVTSHMGNIIKIIKDVYISKLKASLAATSRQPESIVQRRQLLAGSGASMKWEDDVERILSLSWGLGVLSMGAPALAYETWAPGQSNLVGWINLIVGLQEPWRIKKHPQMFHHDASTAVHFHKLSQHFSKIGI